jgi:hypothetical protein
VALRGWSGGKVRVEGLSALLKKPVDKDGRAE